MTAVSAYLGLGSNIEPERPRVDNLVEAGSEKDHAKVPARRNRQPACRLHRSHRFSNPRMAGAPPDTTNTFLIPRPEISLPRYSPLSDSITAVARLLVA